MHHHHVARIFIFRYVKSRCVWSFTDDSPILLDKNIIINIRMDQRTFFRSVKFKATENAQLTKIGREMVVCFYYEIRRKYKMGLELLNI